MRAACRSSIRSTTAWGVRLLPARVQPAPTSRPRPATEASCEHCAASDALAATPQRMGTLCAHGAVWLARRGGAAGDCLLVCEHRVVCGPRADEADRRADDRDGRARGAGEVPLASTGIGGGGGWPDHPWP